jgi:hypothetical protein
MSSACWHFVSQQNDVEQSCNNAENAPEQRPGSAGTLRSHSRIICGPPALSVVPPPHYLWSHIICGPTPALNVFLSVHVFASNGCMLCMARWPPLQPFLSNLWKPIRSWRNAESSVSCHDAVNAPSVVARLSGQCTSGAKPGLFVEFEKLTVWQSRMERVQSCGQAEQAMSRKTNPTVCMVRFPPLQRFPLPAVGSR